MKADALAGITVGLVLVPQSMAYAQLAGMPPYYGLYAACLPVFVGAGLSSQLATGPVAVVSLLTASALAPLALTGSEYYISLAVALALLVGVLQISLGLLKLGVVVSFLSHPVIVGFTNAAAVIIALSQFNNLLGVPVGRSDYFFRDIWGVVMLAGDTHLPTLLLGLAAFAIMWSLKKYAPKFPGVLVAVVMTTVVSWAIGFERTASVKIDEIMNPIAKRLATDYAPAQAWTRNSTTRCLSYRGTSKLYRRRGKKAIKLWCSSTTKWDYSKYSLRRLKPNNGSVSAN
jgi:SulP family sulfate permease